MSLNRKSYATRAREWRWEAVIKFVKKNYSSDKPREATQRLPFRDNVSNYLYGLGSCVGREIALLLPRGKSDEMARGWVMLKFCGFCEG